MSRAAEAFEHGLASLDEALGAWEKGCSPGLLSTAARAFEEAARAGDARGVVGSAFARGLAGDPDDALRRLRERVAVQPDHAGAYVAIAVLLLRGEDPLGHAREAAHALLAARSLAPGVLAIERELSAALAAAGEFMEALQSARSALHIDPDDQDARMWSALLRLFYGGDITAAQVLVDNAPDLELVHGSPAGWLAAVAGHYARAEFDAARAVLHRAIAPLHAGHEPERALSDAARRWFRELRGFGPGVPMSPERALRDTGGTHSDYHRTRLALSALREACVADPERARREGVDILDAEGLSVELEIRTRRGMLTRAARLLVRGFAEVYLPLVACLEPPALELRAAMDLVRLDG